MMRFLCSILVVSSKSVKPSTSNPSSRPAKASTSSISPLSWPVALGLGPASTIRAYIG